MASASWIGVVSLVGLALFGCASSEEDGGPPGSGGTVSDAGNDGSGGSGLGSSTFPSCSDGKKGESETDVDCGGNCPPCDDKLHCETAEDCKKHLAGYKKPRFVVFAEALPRTPSQKVQKFLLREQYQHLAKPAEEG